MNKPRTRYTSSQLVAPAVRMVAVEVWAEVKGDMVEHGVDYHPVVALSSLVTDDHRVEHDALVVFPEFGGLAPVESIACENSAVGLVACPWPESDDLDRLAPTVKKLLDEATEASRRLKKRIADRVAFSQGAAP